MPRTQSLIEAQKRYRQKDYVKEDMRKTFKKFYETHREEILASKKEAYDWSVFINNTRRKYEWKLFLAIDLF